VEWTFATPLAIWMRDLEERWGTPIVSPDGGDPGSVVAVFVTKPTEGARWPVRVRVTFDGEAGGPVKRIAAFRETP
jgi:hypothetical protein